MPSVGQYCNREVVVLRRGEALAVAAECMRQSHVGCVVVVEDGLGSKYRPLGIVTDRDIVVRVLAQTDRYLDQIVVEDVMQQPLITVRESDDIVDALRKMRSAGIRRLVVVDDSNTLAGLLSLDDVVDFLQNTVADLATLIHRERRREQRALEG